jgi:hypothetical protein
VGEEHDRQRQHEVDPEQPLEQRRVTGVAAVRTVGMLMGVGRLVMLREVIRLEVIRLVVIRLEVMRLARRAVASESVELR